jgi:hypothetical protein
MSTRQTWAHQLAARARKVGWDVEPNTANGGYKVRCPDGMIVPLHLTTSDHWSPKLAEKDLIDHGLADAEAKLAAKEARAKATKLAAERRAADTKAAKMAAQSTAITRAAGPYLTLEEVDTAWFLHPHPAPWVRWCLIGPEQAAALLDKANTHNRKMKPRRVDRLTRVMISGQWRTTHQGIAFDTTGRLQDGQHRLQAIVDSGLPGPVMVFVGMHPNNFKAIDENLVRSADQLLDMEGEVHANTLASAVKLANVYVSPAPRHQSRLRPSNADVYDAWSADADALREATMWARKNYRHISAPPAVVAAAYYLLYRTNGQHNPYVDAYLRGLAAGAKPNRMLLDDDDPRVVARRWFAGRKEHRQRTEAIDAIGILIHAWNLLIADQRRRYIKIAAELPRIGVCDPDTSAPPPLIADEVNP